MYGECIDVTEARGFYAEFQRVQEPEGRIPASGLARRQLEGDEAAGVREHPARYFVVRVVFGCGMVDLRYFRV